MLELDDCQPYRYTDSLIDAPMANTTSSPFLKLPREIRDAVYALVISGRTIPIKKHQRNPKHCIGILMACKQTHNETLKLFYSTSIFAVEENWARRGVEWLAALPEQYREWIGRIVFLRDLRSFGNMYSKLVFRAVSEQNQQAMLLEPFLKELKDRGIMLREGVLRA